MAAGITEITENGEVYRGEVKLNVFKLGTQSYSAIQIYDRDKDGNLIKIPVKRHFKGCKKPTDTYMYKLRTIGLHRAMWAWHYGEVPEGMVVDHINNQHANIEDYKLDNLQLLTPAENVSKDKPQNNTKTMKCMLSRGREYYEDLLNMYTSLYEIAKEEGDAKEAHKLRSNISQTKARLRYYDEHLEEAEALVKAKEKEATRLKEKHRRVAEIKKLKAQAAEAKKNGDKASWHYFLSLAKNYNNLA